MERLKAEGPGILNWMLEGCVLWQMHGLVAPAHVLAATSEYEAESNPLNDFLAERCEEGEHFDASASDLHDAYMSWMKSEHQTLTRLTATAFGKWMRKRFKKKHVKTGNIYKGVRLRSVGR